MHPTANIPRSLAALISGAAQVDRVAQVFAAVLKGWMAEDKHIWVRNVETAYQHTKAEGTTIGLFSNLPAKLGLEVDELPFFQLEAGPLPKKVKAGAWQKDFGIDVYFGDKLESVNRMLVPFLTYARLLSQNRGNQLWNIEVGDLALKQPLAVSFKCPRTLVKLAIYGHILVKESDMISVAISEVGQ